MSSLTHDRIQRLVEQVDQLAEDRIERNARIKALEQSLRYLAFGLEMLADGTVCVLPGAITHEGLREARDVVEGYGL